MMKTTEPKIGMKVRVIEGGTIYTIVKRINLFEVEINYTTDAGKETTPKIIDISMLHIVKERKVKKG